MKTAIASNFAKIRQAKAFTQYSQSAHAEGGELRIWGRNTLLRTIIRLHPTGTMTQTTLSEAN